MYTQPVEEIVKIQPKGLVTLPKKVRDRLGLIPNTFARIREDRGSLIIEPVRTLPYPVRSYTDNELAEFIAFDEKQGKQLRRLKKRK